MPVWLKVLLFPRFARRPAPKNQILSRTIGPPNVPSHVRFTVLVCSFPFAFSNGVSTVHAGSVRFNRRLPENVLPPLLVIALIAPPEKRPYSAEIPEVSTWVSAIASSMNRFCGEPNRL